jgi:hypothetical protein
MDICQNFGMLCYRKYTTEKIVNNFPLVDRLLFLPLSPLTLHNLSDLKSEDYHLKRLSFSLFGPSQKRVVTPPPYRHTSGKKIYPIPRIYAE